MWKELEDCFLQRSWSRILEIKRPINCRHKERRHDYIPLLCKNQEPLGTLEGLPTLTKISAWIARRGVKGTRWLTIAPILDGLERSFCEIELAMPRPVAFAVKCIIIPSFEGITMGQPSSSIENVAFKMWQNIKPRCDHCRRLGYTRKKNCFEIIISYPANWKGRKGKALTNMAMVERQGEN